MQMKYLNHLHHLRFFLLSLVFELSGISQLGAIENAHQE